MGWLSDGVMPQWYRDKEKMAEDIGEPLISEQKTMVDSDGATITQVAHRTRDGEFVGVEYYDFAGERLDSVSFSEAACAEVGCDGGDTGGASDWVTADTWGSHNPIASPAYYACKHENIGCNIQQWTPTEPKGRKSIARLVVNRIKSEGILVPHGTDKMILAYSDRLEWIRKKLSRDEAIEIADGILLSKRICNGCLNYWRAVAMSFHLQYSKSIGYFPLVQERNQVDIFDASPFVAHDTLSKAADLIEGKFPELSYV